MILTVIPSLSFFYIDLSDNFTYTFGACSFLSMSNEAANYRLGMKIFANLSGTIAVPAVLAALLGKWLDERYTTSPRYVLLLLAIALLSTAVLIIKKAKVYQQEYESINKK